MWSPYTVSGMAMVQEEGLGQRRPRPPSGLVGGPRPYSRDSGIVEIIDTDNLEDPFIGSGEIINAGPRGVLVHEDGGSVVDLSRGSMTNMSRPPAYEVGT
jgi:hypothetical protein